MTGERVGILLAGGRSRRMGGGDKCLRMLAGKPLIAHAIARARPQVDRLIINANGDPSRFAGFDLPVAPDIVGGFAGPLAGVLTGLCWARDHAPSCTHVTTFATDAPFFPADLVTRLEAALADGADMSRATSGNRAHPVFGLWPVRLLEDLRHALVDEHIFKVDRWTARFDVADVDFDVDTGDPFFNVNTPNDLAAAEALSIDPE